MQLLRSYVCAPRLPWALSNGPAWPVYSFRMQATLFLASKKSLVAYAFVLMCTISTAGFLSGCDGGTHLKGVVLDPNDMPVPDADVKLTTGELNREVKSSDRGTFKVGMTHSPFNPELTLEITKPGFKPFEKRFHSSEHVQSIVATLEPVAKVGETSAPPFSLSIVPGIGGITMAKNKPREFYAVITNVSGGPQSIWQYWNSWGYQAVSFELTMADGKKFALSKKEQNFTVNFPSTFAVERGEHQVYPIKLDEEWEAHPALPKADEIPVALKAVYEVSPTPEASQYKVWTGRLESHSYSVSLRQW
jgi:hypothetical protein